MTSSIVAAGPDLDGAPETFKPLIGLVIVEAKRIGDAATLEDKPRLPLQERMLLGFSDAQRVRTAVQEPGVEQAGNVARLDRAIGDAPLRRLGFDHGFEPEHSARAVADNIDRDPASFCRFLHRGGDLLGSKREGGGVYRNENLHSPASAMIVSSFFGVRRATGFPSIIAAGPQAHRPRQKVCSSVTRPSAVVSPQSSPSLAFARSASATAPTD